MTLEELKAASDKLYKAATGAGGLPQAEFSTGALGFALSFLMSLDDVAEKGDVMTPNDYCRKAAIGHLILLLKEMPNPATTEGAAKLQEMLLEAQANGNTDKIRERLAARDKAAAEETMPDLSGKSPDELRQMERNLVLDIDAAAPTRRAPLQRLLAHIDKEIRSRPPPEPPKEESGQRSLFTVVK